MTRQEKLWNDDGGFCDAMKKTTLRLVVAAACAGVAGGECEVSEWSDWGSCEAFVCQRCDYADAEPGSWTPSKLESEPDESPSRAEAWTLPGSSRTTGADAATMARKFAGGGSPRPRPSGGAGAACSGGGAGGFPCEGVDFVSWTGLDALPDAAMTNDNWGWTSASGVEYAIVGHSDGVSFFELDAAATPVATVAGERSFWRDIKVYKNFALIVSEAPDSHLVVFDLERLASGDARGVAAADATIGDFASAHNVVVNVESARAFVVGVPDSHECRGGMLAFEIDDPLVADEVGCVFRGYVHDAQCVIYRGPDEDYFGREVCFLFNLDELRIIDTTRVDRARGVAALEHDGGAQWAHQGWLNCDQDVLFVDGEVPDGRGTRTVVVDVSDLDAPVILAEHHAGSAAIDHNQYVCGPYLYQANYESGLRVLDASRVRNQGLREVASFDTYPDSDEASYRGAWTAFPFFDSGRVVVNAVWSGFAVVRPTTLRARRRTRAVVSRGPLEEDICPLLVDERACDGDPTPAPSTPRPTPECADSTSWFYKKAKKTCEAYVSKKSKRCKRKDEFKVKASEACSATCGECPECADSTSWFYAKATKSGRGSCGDYVAKKPLRCRKRDAHGVRARDACAATCGECAS